jgi:N-sulfoglucosamine sulfohydrolase
MRDQRPNILLITCHDLGCWLGCYGVPTVQTPHLDALAADGIRFSRSFCVAPQCSPSRATLFTGRYPHSNGVMGLAGSSYAFDLHPQEQHLGQVLHAHGYATALVGVHHECHADSPARIRERCGMEKLVPDFPKSKAPPAEALSCETLRLLARYANENRPFYLQLGYYEPHRQPSHATGELDYVGFLGDYMVPDASLGVTIPGYLRDTSLTREEIAELQGAVHYVDAAIGRVLNGLRELGLEENTLVLFTADHGVGLPRAKLTLYDPGIEVPLILRLPSRGWQGGRVQAELVSNVDVFPTLLDLLGIPVSDAVQGGSLLPLLDGETYGSHDAIFAEKTYHGYYDPMRCIRTERHKLSVNFSAARMYANCTQSWRPRAEPAVPANLSNVTYGHPLIELYDLISDPWELQNLADDPDHKDLCDHLLARLYDWMRRTNDPLLAGAVASPMYHWAIDALLAAHNRWRSTGQV